MYRASLSFIGFEPSHSNVDLKYANVVLSLLEQMDTFANDGLLNTLREDLYNEDSRLNNVSLCAGYPHFFRGMFRSWGRDIALSVTGVCTIHKSRQAIARQIIVTSFAPAPRAATKSAGQWQKAALQRNATQSGLCCLRF